MKKFLNVFLIIFITITISGCLGFGGEEEAETVSFEDFYIQINKDYNRVASSIFEGKQIRNKVLTSYRKGNFDEFNKNFIATRTKTNVNQDPDEFARANSSILLNQMPATNFGGLNEHTFSCKGQEINGFIGNFGVFESVFDSQPSYYMTQFYFVYERYGYVISFMSQEREFDKFEEYIKTIGCD
ncbi:hypothetical protein [Candidatus Absconditicoccus praedator]|uniref:hypothetical protein n=1 Tax=Candidatus Absconditicoccus praedator TaxID=2735562 RepID=UPI001E2D82FC|nr:hypothetical protein [Candidatus Absconditicoccus praedator]UFX83365.1 hypothetical protein HLG78_04520 [Candidatus Absconditicoccus praedator]